MAGVLFLLVSGYVAFKLFSLSQNRDRLKFLGLTIAAVIFFVIQLSLVTSSIFENPVLTEISNFVVEWGHVICLAFILSSLALFIRESKPVFAQFPIYYTGLPLLIILSYMLVHNTYALKTWLIAIYQGGAITVALIMYSVHTYKRTEYAMILSGIIGFLLSYILFWYVPGIQKSYPWIWKFLLGAGMVITIWGYETIDIESSEAVPLR